MLVDLGFFLFGGFFAVLIYRQFYAADFLKTKVESKKDLSESQKTNLNDNNLIQKNYISRNFFLPNDLKLKYRILKNAFGSEYVLVPKVKLSRLVSITNPTDSELKLLKSAGVDFAICNSNNLKIIGAINYSINQKISDILSAAKLVEINLDVNTEYTVETLREIFKAKLLPSETRILKLAV
jgi:hypothetical protein